METEAQQRTLSDDAVASFQAVIWQFYQLNKRSFAWRETNDPYAILVSEIMLQQTQTYRVIPKYEHFLMEFPTVEALAVAKLSDVLSMWQGLGYNRRGIYLQKAAQEIVKRWGGRVPSKIDDLRELPGIGAYTAGAVGAFAFHIPTSFIETNIRAVYLHSFFPQSEGVADRMLMPLIERTIDRSNVRHWYYALMDYGVDLKKRITNPNIKSVHYTKQSKFEGSDRQIRGRIIRALVKYGSLSGPELMCHSTQEAKRFEGILLRLVKEGIILQENSHFKIVE